MTKKDPITEAMDVLMEIAYSTDMSKIMFNVGQAIGLLHRYRSEKEKE